MTKKGGKYTEKSIQLMRDHSPHSSGINNSFYGKHHTDKSKQLMKDNHVDQSGVNNPAWLGGVSFDQYSIEFNGTLKEQIRSRDNYVCQICKQAENGRKHDVHHIDYNKKNSDPMNLITLCKSHHIITNTNRDIWYEALKEIQLCRLGA